MTTDIPLLIDRLDGHEETLTRQGAALDKVRRDLDTLAAAVRRIQQAAAAGQPDWIQTRDPDEAEKLLVAAVAWSEQFLPYLGVQIPACWPWHPFLVGEVLSIAEQYDVAYKGNADKVSDFRGRWLPGFKIRVGSGKGLCNNTEHVDDERKHTVDHTRLRDYARWWATVRVGEPPGITRK